MDMLERVSTWTEQGYSGAQHVRAIMQVAHSLAGVSRWPEEGAG